MRVKLPLSLKIKVPKVRKDAAHSGKPTGVKQGNYTIPYAVALVDEMRKEEIRRGAARTMRLTKKGPSISKIRSNIARRNIKKGGVAKRVADPFEFMQTSKFHPKTMLVLTDAFLTGFNGKVKPRNAFDVASLIRKQVPSLPESLIQTYSNWVYSTIQTEEGKTQLNEFRKKIQKELAL